MLRGYHNKSLKKYLDDLSARTPAPGGGSASGLAGALGMSLLSMAANWTLGKDKYKDREKEIQTLLLHTEDLRKQLLELVDLDVSAYRKLCESKKKTKEESDNALKETKQVPRQIVKCCQKGLKIASVLLEKGNINLISDVNAARILLEAAKDAAGEFC